MGHLLEPKIISIYRVLVEKGEVEVIFDHCLLLTIDHRQSIFIKGVKIHNNNVLGACEVALVIVLLSASNRERLLLREGSHAGASSRQ
jgi:hypothetical protein